MSDSLTGRKLEYYLFPLSISELREHFGRFSLENDLETNLIYGSYPEIISSNIKMRKRLLDNLCDSYLYKDILQYEGIQKPIKITKLLEALAYQIGQQVSFRELSSLLDMDVKTVEKYISILEKSFVIFSLPSFSKNNRNELKFAKKIYFYDLGIRNAVINDYRPIDIRKDKGQIWENFIVAEKLKENFYNFNEKKLYFWRTREQAEIDLLEVLNDDINAYEIKYNETNVKTPVSFSKSYPEAKFNVINKSNFLDYFF